MILLIDNYDSFTYNLYQQIGAFEEIKVVRNDKITVDEIRKLAPKAIVISPGPGYPVDAGISIEVIKRLGGELPILGICLGHQAIGEAFGGKIVRADEILHGKSSIITVSPESKIFKGIDGKMKAARYHSLIIDRKTLPQELKITAEDDKGAIMAVEHIGKRIFGLQFHPESILTEKGNTLIKNFLEAAK